MIRIAYQHGYSDAQDRGWWASGSHVRPEDLDAYKRGYRDGEAALKPAPPPAPTLRTRDVRPWWWWVNPWLYIKRRDRAYDDALDSLYEMCLDVKYPERKITSKDYTPSIVPATMSCIASRCKDCGRNYVVGLVEDNR